MKECRSGGGRVEVVGFGGVMRGLSARALVRGNVDPGCGRRLKAGRDASLCGSSLCMSALCSKITTEKPRKCEGGKDEKARRRGRDGVGLKDCVVMGV
jgi:hypothetical protein